VPGQVSVYASVVEPGRPEGQHAQAGRGHVFHHDVEVYLLGPGWIRPGRRLVIGRELERQTR
jgi:hypothetical protein